jgi:hypothetical protein
MKVACAIDSVGVRKRMQAAKGLETAAIPIKHCRTTNYFSVNGAVERAGGQYEPKGLE